MTTGLAQSIERLTAEREVLGLIIGAGPIVHFTVMDANEADNPSSPLNTVLEKMGDFCQSS